MFKLTAYTMTMGLEGFRLNLAVAAIATCAFWLFGYDMSVMVDFHWLCFVEGILTGPQGGVITEEPFTSTFPEMNNASVQGIVIAAFELGALAGALSCFYVGDKLGRRSTVWFGMVAMVIGGTLQCSAFHVGQLLTGRVISGIGLGQQVRCAVCCE